MSIQIALEISTLNLILQKFPSVMVNSSDKINILLDKMQAEMKDDVSAEDLLEHLFSKYNIT